MNIKDLKRGDRYLYNITDERSIMVKYKYNGINGRVFESAEDQHCLSEYAVNTRVQEI